MGLWEAWVAYGHVPELRGGRLVSGRMEERRWSFQVIVKRRLFGRRVARSGIHSPTRRRAGYAESLPCLNTEDFQILNVGHGLRPVAIMG